MADFCHTITSPSTHNSKEVTSPEPVLPQEASTSGPLRILSSQEAIESQRQTSPVVFPLAQNAQQNPKIPANPRQCVAYIPVINLISKTGIERERADKKTEQL